MVISNHPDLEQETVAAGVSYHHVPVEKDRKQEAEAAMLALLAGNADLLVLARYMQILSGDFLRRVGMRRQSTSTTPSFPRSPDPTHTAGRGSGGSS